MPTGLHGLIWGRGGICTASYWGCGSSRSSHRYWQIILTIEGRRPVGRKAEDRLEEQERHG